MGKGATASPLLSLRDILPKGENGLAFLKL